MTKSAQQRILHTLVLFLAVGISYLASASGYLEGNLLQLISVITIAYIVFQFIAKKRPIANKLVIDFLLLTTLIYLIVFSTGALYSPLYFLIYFLLFAIALLYEPSAAFSLAIISTFFFLLTPRKELLIEFLQIGSLYLIAPLANIFGKQYLNLLEDEEKIKVLTIKGKQLETEVERQEVEVKHWVSVDFMKKLAEIWEDLETLQTDNKLGSTAKEKLLKISQELSDLLKSARDMEKKVNQ